MKKIKAALLIILFVSLCTCVTTFADYIHGFFRYVVSDESVTITAYRGNEEVVTVPAMIGGNPVNTISSDAFADSSVKTVYLPDTIMAVEEGAFGPGQTVVYNSNRTSVSDDGASGNTSFRSSFSKKKSAIG